MVISNMEKTFSELNQIFWDAKIKNGALVVEGVEVTKSLINYTSNSRKSSDWQVTFSWVDADGVRQSVIKESQYKDNRNNDSDRNWGLGRE